MLQRLSIPVLSAIIALLAVVANAQATPGPKILRAALDDKAVAGLPASLEVSVRDPLDTVNGLQVDFGDGTSTAISVCRPPVFGAITSPLVRKGRPAEHALTHVYARPGSYDVHLGVTSGDCGTRGPIVATRTVRITVLGAKVSGKHPVAVSSSNVLARAAQSACSALLELPADAGVAAARRAIACLVNAVRTQAGLVPLRYQSRLALAASRHARDMVARSYFAHQSPSGADVLDRLRRARFRIRGATGENLVAGTAQFGTPLGALLSWLNSPPHRANLLERDFALAGYGVAPAMPGHRGVPGATYVLTLSAG